MESNRGISKKYVAEFIRKLPDNIFFNFLISSANGFYLLLVEKIKLIIARFLNRKNSSYNDKEPLISIYIPTYNRKELLINRSIKSILNQTYKNFELVVCDDGSEDGTYEAVKALTDSRIRLLRSSRNEYRCPASKKYIWFVGSVCASNVALKHIRGQWIAMNGDDDYWTEDHLEKLVTFAQKGNYEFVSSSILVKRNNMEEIWDNNMDPRDPTRIGSQQTWLYRSYLSFFKFNIHCWRKNYFRPNDSDFAYRIWKSGVKTGFLNDVTVVYEPRPGSVEVGYKAL
ncbi:glycosyltransferase family 2 protein [Shewanella sp.]|uniref:glycosyltransferase family 2 protein n=1 Tax=Shewanella sp. TaxID=50422 RepID=UPI004048CD9A